MSYDLKVKETFQTLNYPFPLDDIDRQIIGELQADGRLPFAELGRRVGLSAPSVTERVRRLESWQIITGYRANVDLSNLGLKVVAFVRVSPPGGSGLLADRLDDELGHMPEVIDCHHVTGDDCYIIKVAVPEMNDLRPVVERLSRLGRTTTSVVLSVLADGRPVTPAS